MKTTEINHSTELRKQGNKGQTNDGIIRYLIKREDQDFPDPEVRRHQSGNSRNPSESLNSMKQDIKDTEDSRNLCDGFGCNSEAIGEIEVKVGELGIINLSLCEKCKPKFKQSVVKENTTK